MIINLRMDELRRLNQSNHYRDNLMAKLNHFDKLQNLKEHRSLPIYDFIFKYYCYKPICSLGE